MNRKSLFRTFIYTLRDIRARKLYGALEASVKGNVLDVGGSDFFLSVLRRSNIRFETWTTVEISERELHEIRDRISDQKFKAILEDGCDMKGVASNTYDTVINIQVLEHVPNPQSMVNECCRVLKKGGKAVFLIPQTGSIHMVPLFYANFSRFWIQENLAKAGFSDIQITPIGGVWSTVGSRLFISLFQIFRLKGFSHHHAKRNLLFYCLLPAHIALVMLLVPLSLIMSLGDISEEASNHLVVATK